MIDDELGFRLAGLIDGEGHFGIVRQQKRTSGTYVYGCMFAMNMREDDGPLLERLCEQTGLGLVRYLRRWYGNRKPQCNWRIETKADCLRLVQIIDAYPLWSKKARDYAIWREAVLYMHGPRPEGKEPLERWFNEIRAIREYDAADLKVIEPEPALSLFVAIGEAP